MRIVATAKAAREVVERAWKARGPLLPRGKLSVAACFLRVFRTPPAVGFPAAHLVSAGALVLGRGPLAAPHLVTAASLSPGAGRQNRPLAPQLSSPQNPSGGLRSGPAPARPPLTCPPLNWVPGYDRTNIVSQIETDLQVTFASTSTEWAVCLF